MAGYQYIKGPPTIIIVKPQQKRSGQIMRGLPYFLMLAGIVLLTYVGYPIAAHEWINVVQPKKLKLARPIPEISLTQDNFEAPKTLAKKPASTSVPGVVFGEQVDLTRINSWFPAASPQRLLPSKVTHYNFSIPILGIDQAVVTIGGEDLMESLIHYAGTALPGEYGNAVVFGHSVLPQFFNPDNYKTIFSTLPTLEIGEEIIIDFDGVEFIYQAERYYEVSPEQVDVLQQRYNRRCLRLVTCVPPGTYLRRGIVEACLAD